MVRGVVVLVRLKALVVVGDGVGLWGFVGDREG